MDQDELLEHPGAVTAAEQPAGAPEQFDDLVDDLHDWNILNLPMNRARSEGFAETGSHWLRQATESGGVAFGSGHVGHWSGAADSSIVQEAITNRAARMARA